jgi:predicted cobalt transporter CbtA
MGIEEFADRLSAFIINPILALLFAVGFLVFVWGVVEFLAGQNGVGEGAQNGKRHMLWGLIGMFVMVAAYAILKMIANTLNVQLPN